MAAMLLLSGCATDATRMYGTPPHSNPKNMRQNIAAAAARYLGCPAGPRGARPNAQNCPNGKNLDRVGKFDCSNFTRHIYAEAGVKLDGNAKTQCAAMTRRGHGTPQPGDIVCFAKPGRPVSHIGIAIGEGKFIHAATVQYKRVSVSDLNQFKKPPYVGFVDAGDLE